MKIAILTVIGTLIATILSTGVATFVSMYLNRKKVIERFDLQLQNILSFSIKYPYLENRHFADKWKPEHVISDDNYQRYENYCDVVFNFMVQVCEWKKWNKKKIEEYIDIRNWLRIHEKCWRHPSIKHENSDVYGVKFVEFVNSYIQ